MAHRLKRSAFRLFFAGQVLCFFYFYLFGSQGVSLMVHLQNDNRTCRHQIEQLQQDVAGLEGKINTWHQYASHEKEKVARENLQMAREGDLIFYLE